MSLNFWEWSVIGSELKELQFSMWLGAGLPGAWASPPSCFQSN